MSTATRQAGIVGVLSAVAALGLAVWIGTYEPPPAPAVPPADRAPSEPADPNAPFVPKVGQAGKDVVWVPTSSKLVNAMLDLGGLTAEDYLIDLGSGDGRTVITAARRGARAVGIEFNPAMVELSRNNAVRAGVADRATFVEADLFKADLSRATIITMFLLPRINMQLRPTLLNLAPGTRIVSNSFDMGEWQPDREAAVKDDECRSWCTALLWIVPARVAGTWMLPEGPLVLTQSFQTIAGTLSGTPITGGKVDGRRVTFAVRGRSYVADVGGDTMTSPGRTPWSAHRTDTPTTAR